LFADNNLLSYIVSQGPSIDDPKLRGLIPRITEQIFSTIMESPANIEYTVKVSYMEIYMVSGLFRRTITYSGNIFTKRHFAVS